MNGIYHYCFSSADEVICRDEEDYCRFLNCYALAIYRVGAESLADVVMSNHFHAVLVCGDISKFSGLLRNTYTRYFNVKYGREGKLGERSAFWTELKGVRRVCTAVSYVLRNPLHHGVCSTVFGYKFSSVRALFAKEMGFGFYVDNLERRPGWKRARHPIAKNADYPDSFFVDSDGIVLRKCFTNIAQCEVLYGSVRNFLFQMTRLSGEEWIQEQRADSPELAPVTLGDIEMPLLVGGSGVSGDYVFEHGLKALYNNERKRHESGFVQDLELCKLIDEFVVGTLRKKSVYALDADGVRAVMKYLKSELRGRVLHQEQLKRSLYVRNGIK